MCPILHVCGLFSGKFWLISYEVFIGSKKHKWIPDSAEYVYKA
jgi:hypothetical protein